MASGTEHLAGMEMAANCEKDLIVLAVGRLEVGGPAGVPALLHRVQGPEWHLQGAEAQVVAGLGRRQQRQQLLPRGTLRAATRTRTAPHRRLQRQVHHHHVRLLASCAQHCLLVSNCCEPHVALCRQDCIIA